MLLLTEIMKLPKNNGYSGYKWPSVEEAFKYFFPDTQYVEKHRGADDSKHEAMIVYELYKMKIFTI
jgi:DNA polymerase-3 subunit epsilon